MLRAGAGTAVHDDAAEAATQACARAMSALGEGPVDGALVFAGLQHGEDEYARLLATIKDVTGARMVAGASSTGVLGTSAELESGRSVVVMLLSGEPLPRPFLVPSIADDTRVAGRQIGLQVVAELRGEPLPGSVVALLLDPGAADAQGLLSGIQDVTPELTVVGAGVSGGSSGARVFLDGDVRQGAALALVFPASLRPSVGVTHGCQPLGKSVTITAAEGNLIQELDGRIPGVALDALLSEPENRAVRQMPGQLMAGIGELGCAGRADYYVRPFALASEDTGFLALPDPVRAGQTIRFTLRDAIAAREDMKSMLEEQAARLPQPPAFGLFFNCAGRGSAIYGTAGLDPDLIQRRLGPLPVAGLESSFEIAPCCGRPRIHMFTGALLLAGP